MFDPEMRTIMPQNRVCSCELSLHGKTNNTEHDKPNYLFYYVYLLSYNRAVVKEDHYVAHFVELFKPPSVIQPLQNPLFCGSTGKKGGGEMGGGGKRDKE